MKTIHIPFRSITTLLTLIVFLTPKPTTSDRQIATVLPGGPCAPDDEVYPCIRGAICVNPSALLKRCSNLEPPGCLCVPLNAVSDGSTALAPCVSNVNCAAGQCLNNFCIPPLDPRLTQKKSVCVATHLLQSLPKHELVYDTHQPAVVVCDPFRSCATPGHIVVWRGIPMMMRSYCDIIASCKYAFMLVNSPKYRRGIQIKSDSPDLSFTSMAARYETRFEETLLTTAFRAGL